MIARLLQEIQEEEKSKLDTLPGQEEAVPEALKHDTKHEQKADKKEEEGDDKREVYPWHAVTDSDFEN